MRKLREPLLVFLDGLERRCPDPRKEPGNLEIFVRIHLDVEGLGVTGFGSTGNKEFGLAPQCGGINVGEVHAPVLPRAVTRSGPMKLSRLWRPNSLLPGTSSWPMSSMGRSASCRPRYGSRLRIEKEKSLLLSEPYI